MIYKTLHKKLKIEQHEPHYKKVQVKTTKGQRFLQIQSNKILQ
jgi:hypothetical protein